VASPLLEKYGFLGWFFIPARFIDVPSQAQVKFAKDHQIEPVPTPDADGRIALTREQVRELAQRHIVGLHSANHVRLADSLDDEQLDEEIFRAKLRLEEIIGRPVEAFCWVGGEEWSYGRKAAEQIVKSGFSLSFMSNSAVIRPGVDPFQLQRTNIEADWDLSVVRFQLSGMLDVMYWPKRRRINRKTSVVLSARETNERAA